MDFQVSRELKDQINNPLSSPPRIKKSETKDSISSVDSDVSLSFDKKSSFKSDEADSSDYDIESRFVKKMNTDQDSGVDCVDDVTTKEPKKQKTEVANLISQSSMESSVVARATHDFAMPNDELADKICAQVEYYFSDENIIKDAFLLKHVKRNKEGYVSLKLISSFKKVKHLSRDWRVVGAALTKSKKLEINSQGTKLRRINPLPLFDQTAPSRTILAIRLPIEKLTVESVAEIFKPCGEIALIRVLKPGRPIPPEVRQAIAKRPDLSSIEECAMIEFTDSASARIATQMALGDAKVFELRHSTEKKRKHQPMKKSTINRVAREDNHNSSSCPSGSEPEDGRIRHKKSFQGYPMCHTYPFQGASMECRGNCYIGNRRGSTDYKPLLRRLSTCNRIDFDTNIRTSTLCSSSSEQNVFHRSRSNSIIAMTHAPENVTRMPSGPDGTRGFLNRSAKISMPAELVYRII
ncbi:la-related protein 6 isoform X3 [Pogonomyrmex barbatus]|uniref:La-related protein 6 isoform X3 n=1 Tax=Pogonomyrmex barbatus TaxID=144034 RepID=A0A8N1S442_9HYME|nr:la-related protein 6 isoform X3 [Pogonomyrmex barbatus]XP_025073496.1 la-related protein 6 isoform X3 [Pogonomyrmex barbatus]